MSEQAVDPAVREVPAWLAEMDFCHVGFDEDDRAVCGHTYRAPKDCGDYNGEAICPGCGMPTCPRCAQLCALEEALE